MLRFKSPAAPSVKPIVVVDVLGAIVSVLVPEIAAPIANEFVVMLKLLAPIAILPAAPVVTVPPVMVVAPSRLLLPTAAFTATVAVPASMPNVLAEDPS